MSGPRAQTATTRASTHPAQVRRDSLTLVNLLYGLRVHRGGHGGRAVPPLLDCGSSFVEVNVVRPATFICDVRRAGAPR